MPVIFHWNGEAMSPLPRFARQCDKQFIVGENYRLEVVEERSANSHRHYFACINEAWANLREDYAERFPSPDHLRKFALIKAGFRDERTFVAASKAEAQRLAAFVKPMDEFAVVIVHEATVTVYTAKSQSLRAMGKAEFQRSKNAVLDVVAQMTGASVDDLAAAARRAA